MASAADEEPTSLDFMVLDSTNKPPVAPEQEEISEEELMSKCEEAILKLCSICGSSDDGKNRRPFRIVVVGTHGAGKSSFINGVAAALSENRWHEYAYTGDLGEGKPITIVNQRLPKCANEERERYANVLLPTFIDVAGLSDEGNDKLEELLRLLFYGHIEEDYPLKKVFKHLEEKSKEELLRLYGQSFAEMRVDRVIFVASLDKPLPDRLMACVQRAARPSHNRIERRAVPIYGVLTKMDKVDLRSTMYLEKKKDFMRALGLNHSRFLVCSNYCDDLDPYGLRTSGLRPDLDLPLLRFMQLVCDRALKVTKEDEVLPGYDGKSKEVRQNADNTKKQEGEKQPIGGGGGDGASRNFDPMYLDVLMATGVGLLTLLAFYVLLPSASQENAAIRDACKAGAINNTAYKKLLCNSEGSPWTQFQQLAGQILVATLVAVIVFLYRHISRRL